MLKLLVIRVRIATLKTKAGKDERASLHTAAENVTGPATMEVSTEGLLKKTGMLADWSCLS